MSDPVVQTPADDSVPDAVMPPPGEPRFPRVDGVRAIAALSILAFHSALNARFIQQGGHGRIAARLDAGVAIFFVISAFLLYRPYAARRLQGRRPTRVTVYARRRFLRIVPAYWVALLILGAALPSIVDRVYTGDWWVYFGFLQTYDFGWAFGGLGPAWTLCIEVSFYALLPVYAFVIGRFDGRLGQRGLVRLDLAVLAALALASLAFRASVVAPEPGTLSFTTLSQTILCTFLWFALGMGLAVISAGVQHGGAEPVLVRATGVAQDHPNACWGLAAITLALVSFFPGSPLTGEPKSAIGAMALHVGYGVFAVLVFLPAVMAKSERSVPARVLSNRVVAWLGLVSYGIFLWHQPLSAELTKRGARDWLPGSVLLSVTVATLAVTLVCAAVSYYVVERPFLRLKGPLGKRRGERLGERAAARV